ncbi:MAG: alpha-L-fucosidase [Gemmatales bacterium]|nr:MAG: alpha-L-fucosidase [Gemmatales bacterium]
MSVSLEQRHDGRLIVVKASGKLTKEDYQRFVPEVEQAIEKHGKIHLLFDMHDFHGWTAGALWEDIKFDYRHFSHIAKLALVGEKKWEKGMAVFCKPFTTAQIRYFDRQDEQKAYEWLEADLLAGKTSP